MKRSSSSTGIASISQLEIGIEAVGLLPPEKFRETVHNARVVISHCGEGNLLLLQELGTPFVLVPRTKRRKEHVDDHQLELAQVLERAGLPVALDVSALLKTFGILVSSNTNSVMKKSPKRSSDVT